MSLRKSIIFSVAQRYGSQVITFATGIAIARLLSPAEVGVFTIGLSAITLISALRTLTSGPYFITAKELTAEDLRAAAGINWLFGLLIAVIVFLLSGPVADFYDSPQVATVLTVLAIASLVSPIGGVANILLLRNMRFGSLMWIGLASGLVQAAVAVMLAALDFGPVSLAWGQLAGNVASAVGYVLCVPEARWLRPSFRRLGAPLRVGGWLTGVSIAAAGGTQAAQLMIGKTVGLADLALYARAVSISDNVRGLFYASAVRPALPAFARAERDGEGRMVPIYLRLVAVITGVGWPAYAVLAIWAEPLIVFLYGEPWRVAASILPALCLGSALPLAVTPHNEVLTALRRVRVLFFCEVGLLIAWIGLLFVFSRFGLEGIGVAYVVGHVIWVSVYLTVVKSALRFRFRALAMVWWRSAVVAAAVAAAVAAVRWGPFGDVWPTPLALVVSGCVGALAWLLAIWLTNHEFVRHIQELAQGGWSRLRRLSRRSV
ncbi:MAG: oligosaccharide flippase family protein [Rhodospirillales bacterium]|jgi:O-antigen/teichoic acid export membrane protein|nr:oligosaccharide flippase family protein [Rhodospirillales bacterium]